MTRKVTNAIIESCEEGRCYWESVARECLSFMSEQDVSDMNDLAGFVETDEPEEDEEEDESEDVCTLFGWKIF